MYYSIVASALAAEKVHASSPRRPTASPHSFARPMAPDDPVWPPDVRYLDALDYSRLVDPENAHARAYRPSGNAPCRHTRDKAKRRVKVRFVTDEGHPARGERGLYANKKFAPRERIIDYHGVVTTSEDADETSDYCLAFGLRNELAVDARRAGNEARFANDFRNTGKAQNAKFDAYTDEKGDYKLAVFAGPTKAIAKGEEILISYGKRFWASRFGDDLESFRTDLPTSSRG